MSLPYLDQLDSERQIVFKKLSSFNDHYALAGGTAIMLQIGHRQSYDFDCFCQKQPTKQLINKIKRVFSITGAPKISTPDMIAFTLPKNINISFVWDPYKTLQKPLITDGISLYHLDDLATNKAITIGRRAVWRDYVDMFFFLKRNHFTLQQIISLSDKRFGGEFNEKLFIQQLTYFDDIKVVETTFLKESYTPDEIKKYLQETVRTYLQNTLPIT